MSAKSLKKIRFILEFLPLWLACVLVRPLPRTCLFLLSRLVGRVVFAWPGARRLMTANVAAAFPGKSAAEARGIARESFANIVLTVLDFFWFAGRPDRLEKHVRFRDETMAKVRRHVDAGKGLIFVTPHLGNWELAGLKFRRFSGIPFAVVARVQPNPLVNKLINSGRSAEGNRIISAKGAVKGMARALKDGCFLATLIDQNTRIRDGGIFVDFFGLKVPTSRAPALFGRRFGVPLAVGGCWRADDGMYEMFMEDLPKPVAEYDDDESVIQELMLMTEDLIRRRPEQYLWFYKRFQNIPRDAAEELIAKYPYYAKIAGPRFYSNLAPKNAD